MSVGALQAQINEKADKKLRCEIQTRLAEARALCGFLSKEYPGSNFYKTSTPGVTVTHNGKAEGMDHGSLITLQCDKLFFDRLECVMFETAKEASRSKATAEIMKKVEGNL